MIVKSKQNRIELVTRPGWHKSPPHISGSHEVLSGIERASDESRLRVGQHKGKSQWENCTLATRRLLRHLPTATSKHFKNDSRLHHSHPYQSKNIESRSEYSRRHIKAPSRVWRGNKVWSIAHFYSVLSFYNQGSLNIVWNKVILLKPWVFCLSFDLFALGLSFLGLEFFSNGPKKACFKHFLKPKVRYFENFNLFIELVKPGFTTTSYNQSILGL